MLLRQKQIYLNPKWNNISGKLCFRFEDTQSIVYALLFQEKCINWTFTIYANSWGSEVQLFERSAIFFRRLTVKYKMRQFTWSVCITTFLQIFIFSSPKGVASIWKKLSCSQLHRKWGLRKEDPFKRGWRRYQRTLKTKRVQAHKPQSLHSEKCVNQGSKKTQI